MKPRTLSASSLLVAEACLARYKTENIDRTPGLSNSAAMTGTAVHGTLEMFVKFVYLEDKATWSDQKLLLELYEISYVATFGNTNKESDEYQDGLELVKKWYARTEITDKVISCELKENFPLKTSIGEVPVTFIWDRADQIDDVTYRIVDYKTIRRYIAPEDLKRKIQPRIYGLAAQIKWPNAERIWVTFDMLRHDPVGAVFTREDNIATWKYLKAAAERIIATPDDDAPETLNAECMFCVRKATCKTLMRSIDGGSIFSLTPDEAAVKLLEVTAQQKALGYLAEELDKMVVAHAEEMDVMNWTTSDVKVEITASRRRAITSQQEVARILGPELAATYGSFTLGNLDKLMKSDTITDEQKQEIKKFIGNKWGEPTAKVSPHDPISEQ